MPDLPRRGALAGTAATIALLALLAFAAYGPGLRGPFIFDDFTSFILNPYAAPKRLDADTLLNAALSNESSPLRRPIAALSFALNYYFAGGFDRLAFKVTNLVIHILNGVLVYLLLRTLAARFARAGPAPARTGAFDPVPAVAAALWVVHPIQLTSVLYVVQRMNSMSAAFVLSGLLAYLAGRRRLEAGRRGALPLMYGGIIGGVVLGTLCKENAVLTPAFAGVLELAAFGRDTLDAARRRRLALLYWLLLVAPAAVGGLFVATHPGFVLASYVQRTFDLGERLLTEPRVLFAYVGLILVPLRRGYALGQDDLVTSTGLLHPWTTLPAILGWLVLAALALALRRRAPVLFFAVAWFLVGQVIESTVLGLELMYEHRNYLPCLGIVYALVHYLDAALRRGRVAVRLRHAVLVAIVVVFGVVTNARAVAWSSSGRLVASFVRNHPDSPRAHAFYAEYVINHHGPNELAYAHLAAVSRLDRHNIAGLGLMLRMVEQRLVAAGAPPDEAAARAPQRVLFGLPFNHDVPTLRRLAALLSAEIGARLRRGPMVTGNLKALMDLQQCLYDRFPECLRLAHRIERWFDLALANPRVYPRDRALMWLHAAKVEAFLGKVQAAKIYAESAARMEPGSVYYGMQLVDFFLAVHDPDRAQAVIDRIVARHGRTGYFRSNEVDALARVVAARRAAAARARPRAD